MSARAVLGALVCASLMLASAAHAQPSAEDARALFDEGVRHSEHGELDEAVSAFERSFEVVARASTAYNLAVVLVSLGRFPEAHAWIDRSRALDGSEARERELDALIASMPEAARERAATLTQPAHEAASALAPPEPAPAEATAVTPSMPIDVAVVAPARVARMDDPVLDDTAASRTRRRRRIGYGTAGGVVLVAAVVSAVVLFTRDTGSDYTGTLYPRP